jgi:uncharacterized membrane protein
MENSNSSSATDNGKTVAIVSYITLIGWIVALIIHSSNKTSLGAYHLRQMLGLMILIIAISIFKYLTFMMPLAGGFVSLVLNLGILVLWIFGLVNAANGQEKPVPLVGALFQKWFAGFAV